MILYLTQIGTAFYITVNRGYFYLFSRWRTDQRLLENGEIQRAQEEKSRVEGIQRAAARKRDDQKVIYQPRFFSVNGDSFKFNHTYWSMRNNNEYWDNIDPLW